MKLRLAQWCKASAACLLGTLLGPSLVHARCTQSADIEALSESIGQALDCAQLKLVSPGTFCRWREPSACTEDALDEVVQLLYGSAPSSGANASNLAAQLSCQAAIERAAKHFVRLRFHELLSGQRAETGSRKSFQSLQRMCVVPVAAGSQGGTLPAVAGSCSPAIGSPGTALNVPLAQSCLRATLDSIANQVVPTPVKPDVVVILTDDQRWDTLGYMPKVGNDLLAQGINFRNSFVTTSLCCPSRSSTYSGEYAHNTGVLANGPPLGGATVFDASFALPVWLSSVGYKTALIGKYMNSNFRLAPTVPPGWDVWQTFVQDGGTNARSDVQVYFDYTLNEDGKLVDYGQSPSVYSTDLLRDRTLSFIHANSTTPFFVVYAPFAPHEPAVPALRHRGRFANIAPWRPPNYAEADVSGKPDWVQFMKAIATPAGLADTDALRINMLESLLAVDDAVDAIVNQLESLGLTDDTMVVFTSDNGFHWREHWWAFKQTAYEESMRVPLIIRYPSLSPLASTRDELVLNIDLAPTFAELAGFPVPAKVNGASLLGLLEGSAVWRQDFLEENFGGVIVSPSAAVRTDRWKYIKTDAGHGIVEELYDLWNDPYELTNLAFDGAHDDLIAQLRARLSELQAE
jgi:N-acetylglucosamine-6-sulfatase